MTLNPYLTPFTKIYSKWIKDLNVSPKRKKLLGQNRKENVGPKLLDTGFGNDFLDMT